MAVEGFAARKNSPHETEILWVRYRRGQAVHNTRTWKGLLKLDHFHGRLRGLIPLLEASADRFGVAHVIQSVKK